MPPASNPSDLRGKELHETLKAIEKLAVECFGEEDYYSSVDSLLQTLYLHNGTLLVERVAGEIVGYNLLTEEDGALHCTRRGVAKAFRRKRIGSKLTKKGIKFAHSKGLPYRTYCAHYNIASANSNIRCGLVLEKVTKDWLHLVIYPRSK